MVVGRWWVQRSAALTYAWHALLLRLPFIGPVMKTADTTRFASTLALLTGAGVPMLGALEAAARTMTRAPLREAALQAATRVAEGATLASALGSSSAAQRFAPVLIRLIANGEATGKLDTTLAAAARQQEQTLNTRIGIALALFEPALIVVMGAIVLLIVLAVMLPIIEMNQLVRPRL